MRLALDTRKLQSTSRGIGIYPLHVVRVVE
jgi:hypothetical protein